MEQKRQEEKQILKKGGGQVGQGLGVLKKGGYKLFMLHVSAAFKGGDIQNFWEGGENLIWGNLAFYGGTW